MVFGATAPAAGTTGVPLTVRAMTVTAQIPAALVQAGIGLHLIRDGLAVTGSVKSVIHATDASPADPGVTGTGSGVVSAPGGQAQPLSVTVKLPDQQFTPTAPGTLTLTEALSGSLHEPNISITDGSIDITANLGALTVHFVCKPGTVAAASAAAVPPVAAVTAAAVTAASSALPPFAAIAISGPVVSGSSTAASSGNAQTGTVASPSSSGALAFTGSPRWMLALVGLALMLLDLGYLTLSATRPARRLADVVGRPRG